MSSSNRCWRELLEQALTMLAAARVEIVALRAAQKAQRDDQGRVSLPAEEEP